MATNNCRDRTEAKRPSIRSDDAVLDYPQSRERIRGRDNIRQSRFLQPNQKRFAVRRIIGRADLWVR
jgi:hypothetical protein